MLLLSRLLFTTYNLKNESHWTHYGRQYVKSLIRWSFFMLKCPAVITSNSHLSQTLGIHLLPNTNRTSTLKQRLHCFNLLWQQPPSQRFAWQCLFQMSVLEILELKTLGGTYDVLLSSLGDQRHPQQLLSQRSA